MKILLLTDVPPSKDFSGTSLTYNLYKTLKPEEIICAAVRSKSLEDVFASDGLHFETKYYKKTKRTNSFF